MLLNENETESLEIAGIIKKNYTSLYELAGSAVQCDMFISSEYSWVNNKHIWPNRIFGLKLHHGNVDVILDDIILGMKSGLLPEVLTTSIFTEPSNYEDKLAEHGLEKLFDADGMAIKLNELNDEYVLRLKVAIKEIEVTVTDTQTEYDEELINWCKVVTNTLFQKTDDYIVPYYNVIRALLQKKLIHCFGVFYDEKIIATSMLYISDEQVAGIYHVSTLPEFRGLGIGKMITLEPLKFARNRGCHIGVLFASKLGERVYKQLGFKTYTIFGRYGLK